MEKQWSTNIFDCYNIETVSSCCCLPISLLYTVNKEYQNKSLNYIHCTLLSISMGTYLINPPLGYLLYQSNIISLTSALRNHVRNNQGIISDKTCSDECYDICVTASCPALSLGQVMRQISKNNIEKKQIINEGFIPIIDIRMERD